MKPDSLVYTVFSLRSAVVSARSFPELECWECHSTLEVHQPDENNPDQFLGTCINCGRWYLLGFKVDDDDMKVLELPGIRSIGVPRSDSPS